MHRALEVSLLAPGPWTGSIRAPALEMHHSGAARGLVRLTLFVSVRRWPTAGTAAPIDEADAGNLYAVQFTQHIAQG